MGGGALDRLVPELRHVLIAAMPRIAADWRMALAAAVPPGYATIACPTLLLCGTASPAPARRVVARLAALVPDAARQDLAGLGHMASLGDGAEVAATIGDFLDRADARQ